VGSEAATVRGCRQSNGVALRAKVLSRTRSRDLVPQRPINLGRCVPVDWIRWSAVGGEIISPAILRQGGKTASRAQQSHFKTGDRSVFPGLTVRRPIRKGRRVGEHRTPRRMNGTRMSYRACAPLSLFGCVVNAIITFRNVPSSLS
jgi:hypothetical protein